MAPSAEVTEEFLRDTEAIRKTGRRPKTSTTKGTEPESIEDGDGDTEDEDERHPDGDSSDDDEEEEEEAEEEEGEEDVCFTYEEIIAKIQDRDYKSLGLASKKAHDERIATVDNPKGISATHLHDTPPRHTSTTYLHDTPPRHTSTTHLHDTPPRHTSTTHLHDTPPRHTPTTHVQISG